MEKLKEQLMQQMVDQMSGAMEQMGPEDMARMKDMMASAQRDAREAPARRDPGFDDFMEEFGDFFPENPRSSRNCSSRWRSAWPRCRR